MEEELNIIVPTDELYEEVMRQYQTESESFIDRITDALCYAFEKGAKVDISRLNKEKIEESILYDVSSALNGDKNCGSRAKRQIITLDKMGLKLASNVTISSLPGDDLDYLPKKEVVPTISRFKRIRDYFSFS